MSNPPQPFHITVDRRRFLKSMAIVSAGFTLPSYLAEALTLTPQVTQGPYYPTAANIPLDKDNDLLYLTDHLTAASGQITYVSGRVLDSSGKPIKNALLELWHADAAGQYIYSANSARNANADVNFQGFGQFLTGSTGEYQFRTIKAGLYQGRTRHYHFGITIPGQTSRYTTQLFWNEVPKTSSGQTWSTTNDQDMVLQGITNAAQRASVIKDYTVIDSATGAVGTTWDIVMGQTPMDPTYPNGGTFLAKAELVPGPSGGNQRYALTIPAFANFIYEIYGNSSLAALTWGALPFSLTQTGAIDRNLYKPTTSGSVTLYVEKKPDKGIYKVTFRPA